MNPPWTCSPASWMERTLATRFRPRLREGQLGSVEDKMINGEYLWTSSEQGTAGNDRRSALAAPGDHLPNGGFLHAHCPEKHIVGPCQVFAPEGVDVQVDEAFGPLTGQEGGDG